jgi:hypothetical protein
MYEPNVSRVLDLIRPTDVVLDIGGWARPFNRANYVMDAEPYETRGAYDRSAYGKRPAQGGEREHFTAATWIQRDICERTPFPFANKEIDFVICSHTLEDIRDPLWVCAEMIRVARRGYLEVPSRIVESCRGIEPNQVGWSHHRWLIDIEGSEITFLMKYHTIHARRRFSFPSSYLMRIPVDRRNQWLFWDDAFSFRERTIHGPENIAAELDGFVRRTHPHPRWLLLGDQAALTAADLARRAVRKVGRVAGKLLAAHD